ncbi:MAG TPA: hypothetical protein VG318_18365 [Actinomycetota bacterium]|nr:hypothetical protein [Actinomycetota bacterium]
MEDWGYFLITSGVVWVFAKFVVDTIIALRAKGGAGALETKGTSIDPEALAKLAATPYGPGLTLALLGVVLVLGANGFSVNVGSDVAATPAPAPAPAETFPFPLPTLPGFPTPSP